MTEQEAIRVLREAAEAVHKCGNGGARLSRYASDKIRAALAATATIQPAAAAEPARYEHRMRAPNGHCGEWHGCNKEFFDKFSAAPDIGHGFAYETRALYTAAPAQAATDEVRAAEQFLMAGDLAALKRFYDCCEDSGSGGHDVSKKQMRRLTELGVVRSVGFGRHEITSFGDYVLGRQWASSDNFKLPLKTFAEYNAEAAAAIHTPADDSQKGGGDA